MTAARSHSLVPWPNWLGRGRYSFGNEDRLVRLVGVDDTAAADIKQQQDEVRDGAEDERYRAGST